MPQFYTLLTDVGQAKLANAVALGTTIEITQLAVGDGGGSLPTPNSSATSLVNEVRRAAINASQTDPDNPSWIVVEQVIPPDVGGWTIREIAIVDADGDLIGIGNYPETYKPVLSEGSSRTQTVRFVLEVSDTSAVTLKVDPSVVLATREYVDTQRAEHEQSRDHPAATTTELGFVEKATLPEAKSGAADKFPDAAGVLAAIRQFGLGGSIRLSSTDDFNDINNEGIYGWFNGEPANGPGVDSYGVMFVIHDGSQPVQIVLGGASSQFYQRRKSNGAWGGWVNHRNASILTSGTVHPDRLPAATETVVGAAKVSTQQKVDAGTDDATVVTPKKLRWGFSVSLAKNGFIVFPSWLGGLVFQWGRVSVSNTPSYYSYPTTFPNGAFAVLTTGGGATGSFEMHQAETYSNSQFEAAQSAAESRIAVFFSVGH
ncbi:phage tail protein [Halomonas sp. H5]|uniref:phage tail-collar fiber domain-containing protein n=1 Tax=Halomonas sp. H5 TaxID=3423910 RepID=UPI003D360677